MQILQQIAQHLRDVHFGGNWTDVNFRDLLQDVSWQQATQRFDSMHTIAELVFHTNYFVSVTTQVLQGGPLDAKDKFSFDVRLIQNNDDWQQLLDKTMSDAESLACEIEKLPENRLWEHFVLEKYGNHYRCIVGLIEHCHYHLGQIALTKKMLTNQEPG